jgi:hypothetical protein
MIAGYLPDGRLAALEQATRATDRNYDWPICAGGPVAGACHLGAITHGGGGLTTVDGQPVLRAFDLTWHTLFGDRGSPVRYCPAPTVRAAHLRDLIRWNDDPHRTAAEVAALLRAVEQAAGAEIDRVRRQLS